MAKSESINDLKAKSARIAESLKKTREAVEAAERERIDRLNLQLKLVSLRRDINDIETTIVLARSGGKGQEIVDHRRQLADKLRELEALKPEYQKAFGKLRAWWEFRR